MALQLLALLLHVITVPASASLLSTCCGRFSPPVQPVLLTDTASILQKASLVSPVQPVPPVLPTLAKCCASTALGSGVLP